jgi:hypothetical protein|tara:strand:+ start:260 stop:601 length:342 start_codon:yes stop_codon:yes gene_type:complete
MAILGKVSRPAITPHWQVVKVQATAGACSVEGTTLCSGSGAHAMTLADGSYNGQMALIVNSGAGGAKTVTPATILDGSASTAVLNNRCALFIWVDDKTNKGWAAVYGEVDTDT